MRVVTLNIQHGGGRRSEAIAGAILATAPDVVVLSEFQPTKPGILTVLASAGLDAQAVGAAGPTGYPNTVAIASHLPLTNVHVPMLGSANAQRVLEADVDGLTVGAVYFPLGGPKVAFWRDEFLPFAGSRIERQCLLIGDWNSGLHGLDEVGATLDGAAQFAAMTGTGWTDGWRSLHPEEREYSWYSTHGNGFRLDHAFLSPPAASRLLSSVYRHETRAHGVSDHSALVVDLTG